MSRQEKHLYEFGDFRLDTSERVLTRQGQTVPLTPKAYETLLVLVRNSGHIMEKEELLKEIWQGTFVEEATLAQNIFTLRRALAAGQQDQQKYIETIPRRGYRFVAEVREVTEAPAPLASLPAKAATEEAIASPVETQDESHARHSPDAAERSSETTSGASHESSASARHTASQDLQPDFHTSSPANANGHAAHALLPATDAHLTTDAARAEPLAVTQKRSPFVGAFVIACVVLLVVAGLSIALYRWSVKKETARRAAGAPTSFQSMKVTRLAVNGRPQETCVSPDGRYVAYTSEEGGERSVWVKQTAANSNAQRVVAPQPGAVFAGLVFSRDSQHLYYVALKGENSSQLFRLPVLGGAATPLITQLNSPISFAPDGKHFAFIRANYQERESQLVVAATDGGGDVRRLAARRAPEFLNMPAWSPDGQLIACSISRLETSLPSQSVVGFSATDGAERSLTDKRWYDLGQLAWLADASGIVISAAEEELTPLQIWLVSATDGTTRRITNDLNTYYGVSLTDDAGTLATLQTDRISNLWLVPTADEQAARQLSYGAGKYDGLYGVSFMPDGRIVYASVASGAWDIWTMDADGANQKQLTVDARSNYGPAPSTDGRYIVFVSNRAGGAFHIWRMNSDGTNPIQLTSGAGENFPHVTADNRWVVYATVSFNQPNRIWKVPIEGGEPVPLVREVSSWPALSPDGKYIACTLQQSPTTPSAQLAIFSIDGGEPVKLFDMPPTFRANTLWSADSRSVTYLDVAGGIHNIWSQPIEGGAPKQLTHFKSDGVAAYGWSADGKQLICSRSVETTSVVLIKDFR